MLGSFSGRQKTLQIFTHRYEPFFKRDQFVELEPGEHQVMVDDAGKYVIGYVEKLNEAYFLVPFTAPAFNRKLGEERVKLIINGNFAKQYETIHPRDALNNMFFQKVAPSSKNVVTVEAVPIPVVD